MNKELYRHLNTLVWQNIDFENLNHYLDNLKSRIYKASVQKSYEKIHTSQFHLINSPLVKLFAFKQISSQYYHSTIVNAFQLGYWVSYFDLNTSKKIDLSYFRYLLLHSRKEMELLVNKVKNLIIKWSIEPYCNYLHDLNNLSFLQYYKNYTNSIIGYELYSYCLHIDLRSLFYYIDLPIFINKLQFLNSIQQSLSNFLDSGTLIVLINSLYSCIRLSCLVRQKHQLFSKVVDIFILTVCYEITIILKSYKLSIQDTTVVSNQGSHLLVCCQDSQQLQHWRNALIDILIANGLNLRYTKILKVVFSLRHISTYYMFTNLLLEKLNIYSKPSLKCQYFLFKQMLVILKRSRSNSLFLLVVRLNQVFLSWSNLYGHQKMSRVLALLDYAIHLKLQLFIRQDNQSLSNEKIRQKYFPVKRYSFNSFIFYTSWVIVNMIINRGYYRLYCTTKLSWLVQ